MGKFAQLLEGFDCIEVVQRGRSFEPRSGAKSELWDQVKKLYKGSAAN